MALVIFETRDRFYFEYGYGICLGGEKALLITGLGSGRTGWKTTMGEIPKSAKIQRGEYGVPGEVNLVFNAIDAILMGS